MFQHGVAKNFTSFLASVDFDLALSYYSTSLYTGVSIVKFLSKTPNALQCGVISQFPLSFKPWAASHKSNVYTGLLVITVLKKG